MKLLLIFLIIIFLNSLTQGFCLYEMICSKENNDVQKYIFLKLLCDSRILFRQNMSSKIIFWIKSSWIHYSEKNLKYFFWNSYSPNLINHSTKLHQNKDFYYWTLNSSKCFSFFVSISKQEKAVISNPL